jgi:hypothetical protein
VADLYVALLHHPVLDRHGAVVTTALTNIDVHDIARSCRTFGVRAFYVVTPVDAHRALARRVVRHWQSEHGAEFNPSRHEALERVRLARSLEGVEIDIEKSTGSVPRQIATSARPLPNGVGYAEMREALESAGPPFLLLLGTGSGLTADLVKRAPYRLAPIPGVDGYNHLSVRAAAAVLLDRLASTR